MKYRVVIEQDEDGKFIATCPSLPWCVSDGDTRSEAHHNIKDAVTSYLESLLKSGDPIPSRMSEDVVDINVRRLEGAW